MTTCWRKSCSFSLPWVSFVNVFQLAYVFFLLCVFVEGGGGGEGRGREGAVGISLL